MQPSFDRPVSQRYPFPFSYIYPDTGNFIGFVGNLSSRSLVRRSIKAFGATTAFLSEGVAAPSGIEGVHWSDHWSFWEAGYPAIMVTDTAPFRYPHYHTSTDTPEKIDYTAMARVPAVWRKSSGRLLLASCAYLMDTGRNGSTLDRRSDLALLA